MGLLDELDALDNDTRERILKPPFSYHGGKSKLVNEILPHLPYRSVYVEPCGGSGAVLLSRKHSKLEVYNDRYSGVVDFYRCLRSKQHYERLYDMLDLSIHSRELFLEARDTWKDSDDIVERAARWYYMLLYSFGSHGRNFGRATYSNCVFAGKIHRNLALFPEIHRRLQNVQIENLDILDCIRDYDSKDTVFYIDPPYLNCWSAYSFEMKESEHKMLLDLIQRIKGFVAISGYANSLYDKYPWDERHVFTKMSTARAQAFDENNCKSDSLESDTKRDYVEEVLWIRRSK